MDYKRLTQRGLALTGRTDRKALYYRLAILEDMIEDGILIERYFIQEDELPSGKVWYNVCEISETHCHIEKQCDTREEAEARLAELRGE